MGRHIGGEHLRLHRLEQVFLGGLPEVACINRVQHGCRRVGAFGLQARQQRALGDAWGPGERLSRRAF